MSVSVRPSQASVDMYGRLRTGEASVALYTYRAGRFCRSRMEDIDTGNLAPSLDMWPHDHKDWSHNATLLHANRTCSRSRQDIKSIHPS